MLMRHIKAAAGFTLIEMVVTMTIFSILAALTVPTMKLWIMNSKVRAAADSLQNGLRQAQAESLRRSRQVVFALTNSTTPSSGTFTAAANGSYWAVAFIPAMTDGTETATFVESGELGATNGNVHVTGPAEICFNSVGRLVTNTNTGVAGGTCAVPTATTTGTPPRWVYQVQLSGADHSMQVEVSLGGQVHMCDPTQTLSGTNPYGC